MSSEKKYTDEEVKAIVDDALRKAKEKLAAGLTPEDIIREDKELTPDELESAAGGRTLTNGQEITRELIEQYAAAFKALKANSDVLRMMSDELGFWPTDEHGMVDKPDYEGAWIDYWATKQKSKVRQTKDGGDKSFLDRYSTG